MTDIIKPYSIDCLDGLIGITRTQCVCYDDLAEEKKILVGKSRSGLFIDEEPRLNNCLLLKGTKCQDGDMYDRIAGFRSLAMTELLLAIATRTASKYQPKIDKQVNYGSSDYGSLATKLENGEQGFSIKTANLAGGVIHLQYIGFLALLPPNVWSELVLVHVDKISISGTVERLYDVNYRIDNQSSWMGKLPVGNYSPLPDDGIELICDGSTYKVWYDYDKTKFTPYQNELSCGGCAKSKIENGVFYVEYPIGDANGLMLSARLYCDPLAILCNVIKVDNLIAMLAANALLYKTLELLISKLRAENSGALKTPQILQLDNKTTDNYAELVINYGYAFQQTVNEIVDKMAMYDNVLDCFICRKNQVGARTGMIQ